MKLVKVDDSLLLNLIENRREYADGELDFSSVKTLTPTDLRLLADALKLNTFIKSVKFRDCALTPGHIEAFKGACHVVSLDLSNNPIGPEGAKHVSEMEGVRMLDVAYCGVRDEGAQYLAQSNVTDLIIDANQVTALGAKSLGQANNIQRLSYRVNRLHSEDAGGEHIAKGKFESIDFRGSNVGGKTLKALGENQYIRYLGLSNCRYVASDAANLETTPNLRSVDLMHTGMSENDALAVARNPNLETVNLGYNRIADKGCEAFAKHPNISSFTMYNCFISDAGATHFLSNDKVTYLDLRENPISSSLMKQLAEHIALNRLRLLEATVGHKLTEDEKSKFKSTLSGGFPMADDSWHLVDGISNTLSKADPRAAVSSAYGFVRGKFFAEAATTSARDEEVTVPVLGFTKDDLADGDDALLSIKDANALRQQCRAGFDCASKQKDVAAVTSDEASSLVVSASL